MRIRAFITHKKAESFIDCQDRFSINPDTKSIALSDGMSQSIFQKYWAEILVDAYTSKSDWYPNLEAIRELSHRWSNKVDEIIKNQKLEGKSTWRVERSVKDGCSAGATLLGIRFNGLKWRCEVLGDSCLVLIHNYEITDIISSQEGVPFGNNPDYYDSNPKEEGKGQLREKSGELCEGDTILLVSDPFSDFLFKKRRTPEEKDLIQRLLKIGSHEEFEKVVEEWRDYGMHNDDSTLIIVEPDDSDVFHNGDLDDIEQLIFDEKSNLQTIPDEDNIRDNETEDSFKIKLNKSITLDKNSGHENLIGINKIEGDNEKPYTDDVIEKFNQDFIYSLEVNIYSNLKGLMLFKRQKKERAKTIAKDIQQLLHHTLMKK